jgi:hypothetical protein
MEELVLGVFIGIGLAALKRVARPVAKGVIKIGLTTADAAKEAIEEGGESLSDLVAEVKQEVAAARRADEDAEAGVPVAGAAEPSTSN